jgi:hypothetical protein
LLEGKNVNLVVENHDVSLLAESWSNPQYMGEYQYIRTLSPKEKERMTLIHPDWRFFIIIKKNDGVKIGHANA